ncbi:MAG: threonine synthase, partial [Candidatus Zixiibacteriota bacterium]
PPINQIESKLYGAKSFLINGLITDCGRIVREGSEKFGWFNLSTLREPYRIEGKKTMGLELAEQFDWKLPDVILYPTGGGTGLIGMWKGFNELKELGWLESAKLPRMIAVQSSGCCPIVRAFERDKRFAEAFPNAQTVASGLRVPSALGDFMILDAIRESGGTAVAVDEAGILDWMKLAARETGLSICPEAAACVGALEELVRQRRIDSGESVVIFNTASALKYLDKVEFLLPRINIHKEVDWPTILN